MARGPSEVTCFEADAERIHLLLDAVTEYAIYMLNTDGLVTSWNAGAEHLKGYGPAEILGQQYERFFTRDDQQRNVPAYILATAKEAGRHESEGWRVRKDGGRFWASASLHKVQDKAGRHIGFVQVTCDTTQRKATQDALLESERQFRILVQGVTDYAIYMVDPSGIIVNWNTGAERIKGYTAGEIIGQHVSRFYSREDRAAGLPALGLATAAREGSYETEGWRVRKDGTRFWAAVVLDAIHDPGGDLIGFAKITRDITERREAQDRLRESERQFRLLVNGVTDYALFMLDPNGIVTSWNAGAERIKGYTAAEIIGQHFSRFYTASERAAGVPTRALQTAMTQGRFEAESWRVRKDGSLFWANVVIDPILDDNGQVLGFSKLTRDITERREAQLAMQKTQAQLAQIQKMEALGQLTGGVAHDFNNLLMVVSGYIPLIKQRLANDRKGLHAAEAIELAAQRGATLTRQLLSFSRRQSLNPTVVHLNEVMEAARPILDSLLGGTVRRVTTILPDVWPVRVDRSELELAIVNMSVNARDAMGQGGGTIALTAENASLIRGDIADNLEGDFVALTVADTGQGMPPDILAKVFDPFFTTKGEGKGTGLGLSQVHGFVHQSGGGISIASEMGQGTRISLYLPRTSAEMNADVPAETQSVSAGACKVLLVEDNPDVADVTVELLAHMGCCGRFPRCDSHQPLRSPNQKRWHPRYAPRHRDGRIQPSRNGRQADRTTHQQDGSDGCLRRPSVQNQRWRLDSQGSCWTAAYINEGGNVVRDLRADIAAEAGARQTYEALIKACDDEGTKKTLTHLLTREITHANMFMKALDAMGKLDDPMFGNIPPDDTVKLVFNLSQGEDVRGPWNEEPDFEYVAEPEPMGGMPPAPVNPDDERSGEPSKGRRGKRE